MIPVAWMISKCEGMGGLHVVQPFVAEPGGRMQLSRVRLVASSVDAAHALLPRRAGLKRSPNHHAHPDALKTYVVRRAA